jgi:TonB-linked SusC/RagA family outer membrane protein
MVPQEVALNGRTTVNVSMAQDAIGLDEVIAIGYGVQRKSNVTGSIASVKAADMESRTATNAAQALQGKVSGVQVMNTNAAPGAATEIRIRGYSSNTSGASSPLYIVDGLIVKDIQYLDPNNIESIEILKDAASAAIYGAQAGNGVVLVTTKRASQGSSRIFYEYQMISNSLGEVAEVMNAEQYIGFQKEAGRISDQILTQYGYDGTDTNWTKEMFVTSPTNRHTIGFMGANDRGNVFVSLNHLDDQGMVKGPYDYYKRLTSQLNVEYKLKDWLTIGSNNSIDKWERQSPSQQTEYGSVIMGTIISDPLTPVYYDSYDDLPEHQKSEIEKGRNVLKDPDNGKYYAVSKYAENDSGNPLIMRDRGKNNKGEGINVRGTFYLNFNPIKNLVYTSRFGYALAQGFEQNFTEPFYANSMAMDNNYSISRQSTNSYYYQWENFINYSKSIGKNEINGMAGMSFVNNRSFGVSVSASGVDILTNYADNFRYLNYLKSDVAKTVNETNTEAVNMAYFGRLSWNYDSRYNIQANLRADAFDSSKLSRKSRWGYFPSVSAGWTISNESFVKDIAESINMNHLMVRASWGQNGNISALSNYQYNASIAVNSAIYQWIVDNPSVSYGSLPSGLVNDKLKWETSEQIDIGLLTRFFNSRLSLEFDYYNKKTKDLLINVDPVYEVGIANAMINAGNITNSGLEFDLGWNDRIGDFSYSVNAKFSTLQNKVTYLDPSVTRIEGSLFQARSIGTYFEQGFPLWYIRGYKYTGVANETVYFTDKSGNSNVMYEPGDPMFDDLNNDGQINIDDLQNVGSGIPDYTYGLTLTAAYKNFDIIVFGTGVGGNDILACVFRYDRPRTNGLAYYYDNRWTPTNTNASMPRIGSRYDDQFWKSSAQVFKGDFFKIKQIQLGYTLPEQLLSKMFISNLRVYVSLDDYFTFTKYPGFDPETSSANSGNGIGVDKGSYPTSKKFMFGVNVSF